MNINWKLRLKNKATLTAIIAALISLVYNILDAVGVVPSIGQDRIMEIVTVALTFLALIGIITDPTTSGVTDSKQAMNYEEPKQD